MHLIKCFLFHEDRVYNAMGIRVSRRECRYRLRRPQKGIKGIEQGRGGNKPWDRKVEKRLGCTRRGNGVAEEGEKLIKI